MRLLIELEEDGPVTAEAVRANVEQAIIHWRANVGLSADTDDGQINTVSVSILDD